MLGSWTNRARLPFSLKEVYLRELRGRWGKPIARYRDRSTIATLYRLTLPTDDGATVDDGSWSDLDMDALFDRLDGTTTPLGRQLLYRQLRTYEPDETSLRRRYETARLFVEDRALRETVQLNLWRLRTENAAAITPMLFGQLPEGGFSARAAWLLAALSSGTIAVAVLNPALFWLPFLPVLANFVFAERHAHRIGRHSVSFVHLRDLLIVAHRLSGLRVAADIVPLTFLSDGRPRVRRLRGRFRLVGLDSTSGNVVVAQIAYLLNLVCLFDFLVFSRCARRLVEHGDELREIHTAVASLDAAIALGSYLAANAAHCNPRFHDDPDIDFAGVTHPLLDEAVPNDFRSEGLSAFVTGSNMAGKSTFIKAIGTNLVLARTCWLCHARAATLPRAAVMSSIKRSDSLEEGRSYHFAEVEALRRLVEASESVHPRLFLIDEIFNGTNTVERIAGAAAVLDYLARGHAVMVTSHDVELGGLISSRYRAYHFRETGNPARMFDYELRPGHVTTRNAIALLDAVGFPAEVIDEARAIAATLDARESPDRAADSSRDRLATDAPGSGDRDG